MTKKIRIDQQLVDRDLVDSLKSARSFVMAGKVFVNGQRLDKAGTKVKTDAQIELRDHSLPYVSRGGLKLQAALDAFDYDPTDLIAIDVGASTGGFTDCLLQRGAQRVYAVDVGYGLLAWKLRNDPRVVVLERENIRHLSKEAVEHLCDLAVIDCSFISLHTVLPPTLRFLKPAADIIALIKPQFEVSKDDIEEGGVVRDDAARERAIDRIISSANDLGLSFVKGLDSPVHGPAGNIEYLVWLRRTADGPVEHHQIVATEPPSTR